MISVVCMAKESCASRGKNLGLWTFRFHPAPVPTFVGSQSAKHRLTAQLIQVHLALHKRFIFTLW